MYETELGKEKFKWRGDVIKQGIIIIVGMILSVIPVMKYYPFGGAYTAGLMTSRSYRLPAIIAMLSITTIQMSVVDKLKYGLIIATIFILVRVLEGKGRRMRIWETTSIAALTVLFLEGTDAYMNGFVRQDKYILFGLVLLTVSAGYMSEMFIDCVMSGGKSIFRRKVQSKNDSAMLKTYERKLRMMGEAFKSLARTSEKWQSEDEVNGPYKKSEIENKVLRDKLSENRKLLTMYLCEMGDILSSISKDMEKHTTNFEDIKNKICMSLSNSNITVRDIHIIEDRGYYQIVMKMKSRGTYKKASAVSKYISEIMGKSFVLTSGNKLIDQRVEEYTFEEDVNYIALHGIAKKSMDGTVSGDSFSCMKLDNGQTLLSISDGMGTGIRANKDSEKVVELIEEFINCGFSDEMTLKLINGLFVTNEGINPATVDMSIIDMHSGVCDIVKSGAATTYVKRDGWVEAIKSTSLPIGVMDNVDVETTKKKLYDGEFLIMVSDGLVESVDNEEKDEVISEIILNAKSKKPKELAMEILETVTERVGNTIEDDMTVLVTGVWDKIA